MHEKRRHRQFALVEDDAGGGDSVVRRVAPAGIGSHLHREFEE